ncbi:MAG TPA: thioesterase family protein [Thermoplasmata archaeon]|nr:thioesterase family protein [Thermoplasmata archaeon]
MIPGTNGPDAGHPWPTQRRFTVFYHDLDVLGHLNHAVYFPYMETLRCDYYLRTIGSLDPSQLDIILAEASCRYLAPAFYGTEMVGEVTPSRPLGRTSFTLLYRFRDPQDPSRVYARGRTVVVCYDYGTNAKKEIPPDRRRILDQDAVDPKPEGW